VNGFRVTIKYRFPEVTAIGRQDLFRKGLVALPYLEAAGYWITGEPYSRVEWGRGPVWRYTGRELFLEFYTLIMVSRIED